MTLAQADVPDLITAIAQRIALQRPALTDRLAVILVAEMLIAELAGIHDPHATPTAVH